MSLYKDVDRILISKEQIQNRIKELAKGLSEEYKDKNPLVICILKGSVLFYSDLVRAMDIPLELEFMAISSYESATKSSGEVRVVKDTDKSLEGRHVIIVEDIVDSGLTLKFLQNMLGCRNVASLACCALLDKPSRREVEVKAEYTGFEIENCFVIGYGLDYGQKYRNMPDICVLKSEVYSG